MPVLTEGCTWMTTELSADTPMLDTPEIRANDDAPAVAVGNRAGRRAVARSTGLSTVDALLGEDFIQRAVAELRANGGRLTGPDGFLSEMVKRLLEAGLDADLTEHLGYARHDSAGRGSCNSRKGSTP